MIWTEINWDSTLMKVNKAFHNLRWREEKRKMQTPRRHGSHSSFSLQNLLPCAQNIWDNMQCNFLICINKLFEWVQEPSLWRETIFKSFKLTTKWKSLSMFTHFTLNFVLRPIHENSFIDKISCLLRLLNLSDTWTFQE